MLLYEIVTQCNQCYIMIIYVSQHTKTHRLAKADTLIGAVLCWWPDKVVVVTREVTSPGHHRQFVLAAKPQAQARAMAWEYGMEFHDMTKT